MKHLTTEDLVLHYYGEDESAAGHLAACDACRREYHVLQRTLNAVDSLPVPERGPDYESTAWRRLAPRLPARPKRLWWTVPKWAVAGAMALLVIGAFLIGRGVRQPRVKPIAVLTGSSERILLVAVGDHLERTQMVLAELAHAEAGKGELDISYEQKAAEDLVETNRLYRMSANSSGDGATASLLDDLERVLLEIAHSPAQVSGKQLQDLRHDIEDQGLLFKVRVYQTKIQQKEKSI